jgi:hypothetical protein
MALDSRPVILRSGSDGTPHLTISSDSKTLRAEMPVHDCGHSLLGHSQLETERGLFPNADLTENAQRHGITAHAHQDDPHE